MQIPAPSSSQAPLRTLALAVVVAAALNGLTLDVIGNARVFLGSFVLMPFVLSQPPVRAILAAMVALVPSVFALGHPFALLLGGAEAAWLVVGVRLLRRNAILVDAGFWVLAGLPLVFWWYAGIAGVPNDLTRVIFATQTITGLTAVVVGYFVLHYTSLGARVTGSRPETASVREVIFNLVFVLSLVPLALVALGFSLLFRHGAEADANERAFFVTRDSARQIDLFFELHESAVISVARVLEKSPAGVADVLKETKRSHPRIITMLVADSSGRIVQTAPDDQQARLQGQSVADRDYFRAARETRRPFISGVFRGRGFGSDILIAISVPMFDQNDRFAGIVEASVQVESIAQLTAASSESRPVQLVLADSAGRVIYADAPTGLHSLQNLQDTALAPALRAGEGLTPFSTDRIEPDGTKRRVINRAERCRTVGIIVVAQWPVLDALAGMKAGYALMGLILLGILASAMVVSRAAHRRLSAPLEGFSAHTARQISMETVAAIPSLHDKIPREVAGVFEKFNQLAVRLNQTHDELRRQNAALDQRVTERTRDAESARRQAEAANRSKTDFLAMTSHEIRTPLNAVIGLTEALAENPSDPRAAERLRTIHDSSIRLMGVVNDLLDLSRAEAGRLELRPGPVELGVLCAELRSLLTLRAEQKGLRLDFAINAPAPRWFELDGPRLQQVLINLIGNALKFTPTGGVTIRIDLVHEDDKGAALRFAVIDTGPGITKEEQSRLFQPYVQLSSDPSRAAFPQGSRASKDEAVTIGTDRADGGTGLGLSISQRIVALFGGKLALRSEPGQGSEFIFTIVAPRTRPPSQPAFVIARPPRPSSLRVLAVDDNPANREVLSGLLEQFLDNLLLADSGRAALRSLQQEKFDVALIDLEMPDLDGLEVARTVRAWRGDEASRGCRLVAFSAHHRSEMWEPCAAAGFDDFVEKPIDRHELYRAVAVTQPSHPSVASH